MRRLDWPDEPGWWWAIRDGKRQGAPVEFMRWPQGEIELASGESSSRWRGWQFEGPIPEPKVPMRFEIEGRVWHWDKCRGSIIVEDIVGVIPKHDYRMRFKITMEELCD